MRPGGRLKVNVELHVLCVYQKFASFVAKLPSGLLTTNLSTMLLPTLPPSPSAHTRERRHIRVAMASANTGLERPHLGPGVERRNAVFSLSLSLQPLTPTPRRSGHSKMTRSKTASPRSSPHPQPVQAPASPAAGGHQWSASGPRSVPRLVSQGRADTSQPRRSKAAPAPELL